MAREPQPQHALQLRDRNMEGGGAGERFYDWLREIGGEEAQLETTHAELRTRDIRFSQNTYCCYVVIFGFKRLVLCFTMIIPERSATAEATPIRWASNSAASDELEFISRGVGTSCSTTEPVIRLTTANVPERRRIMTADTLLRVHDFIKP